MLRCLVFQLPGSSQGHRVAAALSIRLIARMLQFRDRV